MSKILKGITLGRRQLWGTYSLTLIISYLRLISGSLRKLETLNLVLRLKIKLILAKKIVKTNNTYLLTYWYRTNILNAWVGSEVINAQVFCPLKIILSTQVRAFFHFLETKMGKMKKNKVATEKCLLSIIKQQQLGSCSAMCLSSPYCQHIQYLNDEDILEQNF